MLNPHAPIESHALNHVWFVFRNIQLQNCMFLNTTLSQRHGNNKKLGVIQQNDHIILKEFLLDTLNTFYLPVGVWHCPLVCTFVLCIYNEMMPVTMMHCCYGVYWVISFKGNECGVILELVSSHNTSLMSFCEKKAYSPLLTGTTNTLWVLINIKQMDMFCRHNKILFFIS